MARIPHQPQVQNETVLEGNDVERVTRGSALGSMMGNTGLAIYYPTDQLVPIINFTAQGLRMVAPIHKTYLLSLLTVQKPLI